MANDDKSALLSGATVNVFIGPKRKCFSIHKALLSASCTYFQQHMEKTEIDEENIAGFYLPDDDSEVFQLLHTWLYRQQLKPVTKKFRERGSGFEVDHPASTDLYFELYYMAEMRQLHDLQNLAMNRIREFYASEDTNTGLPRYQQVYKRTQPGSPMRNLIVQQFLSIYFKKTTARTSVQSALHSRLHMANGEAFMMDLFEALRTKASKKGWPSPNTEEGCLFHHHELGKQCESLS